MARYKITCKNTLCIYQSDDNRCLNDHIDVGYDGCESFKPALAYYTNKAWNMLGDSNFITTFGYDLTPERRAALYVVATLWNLKIANDTSHGLIYFCDESSGPLKRVEIIERDLNYDELDRLRKMCADGSILSLVEKAKAAQGAAENVELKPYGYLSPSGEFTESPWGTHEGAAQKIIDKRGWGDEFDDWQYDSDVHEYARDFVVRVKGYALIHDPSNLGYTVTHIKELTKHQKDFLYGYFIDMGMRSEAELYVD